MLDLNREVRDGAWAYPRIRRIVIPPVTDLVSYYLALHEFGHIVGRGRSRPLLEAEANAWVYAFETAKWPPTATVREFVAVALDSYTGGCG